MKLGCCCYLPITLRKIVFDTFDEVRGEKSKSFFLSEQENC